jgi:hypothetical protein
MSDHPENDTPLSQQPARRNCPLCDEQISAKAIKCKHCRSLLECPYCHEALTASASDCPHCGSNLGGESKAPAPIVEVKAEPMPPTAPPPPPPPQQQPAAPVQQVSIQPVIQPPAPAPAPIIAPQAPAPQAPPVNVQFNAPSMSTGGSGDDLARRMLASKSYVGPAIFTLIGYWLGYLPGLIMNFVFLSSAKRDERIAGHPMAGKGCLVLLIWLQFYIPLVLIIIGLIVGAIVLVIGLATGQIK